MYLLTSALTLAVVVMTMQEWSVLLVITSRLIQAGCNLKSGSTGQLSGASVFLVFLASLGRAFRSTQTSAEMEREGKHYESAPDPCSRASLNSGGSVRMTSLSIRHSRPQDWIPVSSLSTVGDLQPSPALNPPSLVSPASWRRWRMLLDIRIRAGIRGLLKNCSSFTQ
ncbi:hypothetical protein AMELA_G00251380 [Ameiurus melas]|uniref:Uncharacterized protein n=1 Tax=Ameiurus melas TaxID=219545 RepID=A0A7J5ZQG9_AMEME|nr:hypothetical protein AMELA_G00251380 [Ameiurus melas]